MKRFISIVLSILMISLSVVSVSAVGTDNPSITNGLNSGSVLKDALFAHFDFEGETEAEARKDHTTGNNAFQETLGESDKSDDGKAVVIQNGVATIQQTNSWNRFNIYTVDQKSDFKTLTDELTVGIRFKVDDASAVTNKDAYGTILELGTSGKDNDVLRMWVAKGSTPTLNAKFANVKEAKPITTFALNTYLDAVLSMKLDATAKTVTITVYTSVDSGVNWMKSEYKAENVTIKSFGEIGRLNVSNSSTGYTISYDDLKFYNIALSETQIKLAVPGVNSSNSSRSVLYGRSALFCGDSITAGACDSSAYKGWAGRVGMKNNMNYINAGVSGSSISTCRANGSGRIISQLNKHEGKTFDYVIMHGGVNDAWDRAPIGTVTSGFDASLCDIDSFAGGLEETFARAKELFPDATLGFIMNIALPKCTKGDVSSLGPYMAIASLICEKWGVEYLDLFNNEDFCYNVFKVDSLENFGDNYYCHPSATGYDLIAPLVEEWMEALPHSDNPKEDEILPEPPVTDEMTDEKQTSEKNTSVSDESIATEEETKSNKIVDLVESGCSSSTVPSAGIAALVIAGAALASRKGRTKRDE